MVNRSQPARRTTWSTLRKLAPKVRVIDTPDERRDQRHAGRSTRDGLGESAFYCVQGVNPESVVLIRHVQVVRRGYSPVCG